MDARITVKELAEQLKIPVHRIYYAISVGAIAATFDSKLCRYFFDASAVKNAILILTGKGKPNDRTRRRSSHA